MDTVIVIGAGVTGLTTALTLKRMGYPKVTVVAKYIPGDMCVEYTSPYAGKHSKN
jgi:D-amino-acid oxidase